MKSHIRRIQICVFILLHSVVSQDIKGFVGTSAVLPCSSTSLSKVNVFWRYRNEKVLLDIKNGSEDLNFQDQKYKGRVSSFPTEYKNKNFSITLRKLELDDTGDYQCIIVIDGDDKTNTIKLSVMNSASCVSRSRIVLQMLVVSALSLIYF